MLWRSESEREAGSLEREEKREGEGAEVDKKKRSSKLTAASGRPGATGSPLSPENSRPVLLQLAASPCDRP